jgi:UDP-3-O-[3-hydroxymyristoyl] glucosamine N-acyltransferase
MKISLSQIAALVQGEIVGNSEAEINGAAPFEQAGERDITVAGSAKFLKMIERCRAAAIIVPPNINVAGHSLVQVQNPMVAFARVLQFFHPAVKPSEGIHSRAEIGRDFKHGPGVSIGPMVVVGNRVAAGRQVWLHPGVVIGDDVSIGDDVVIYPNVTVRDGTIIGSRVIIHSGTVIGSDGFGFAPDGNIYHKLPHTGIVQIDDDVEIGANNTIDRGTFGRTHIGRGVKTDNLVHIAHNVTIGENTVLVAQVGISGSVTIGSNAVLAGQAGIAGHLHIGDRATVGPQTGVGKPVPAGEIVSGGIPEMPHRLWLRVVRTFPKLPEINKRLSGLEKIVKHLQDKIG